jgi:hypothetical protein
MLVSNPCEKSWKGEEDEDFENSITGSLNGSWRLGPNVGGIGQHRE